MKLWVKYTSYHFGYLQLNNWGHAKRPSIYYLSTFLDLFWPTHYVNINTVLNVSKKLPFFNQPTNPPSSFADVIYGCSLPFPKPFLLCVLTCILGCEFLNNQSTSVSIGLNLILASIFDLLSIESPFNGRLRITSNFTDKSGIAVQQLFDL